MEAVSVTVTIPYSSPHRVSTLGTLNNMACISSQMIFFGQLINKKILETNEHHYFSNHNTHVIAFSTINRFISTPT